MILDDVLNARDRTRFCATPPLMFDRARKIATYLKGKNLDKWMAGYVDHAIRLRQEGVPRGKQHLLFAFCDHYEPLWGGVSKSQADARVAAWLTEYPRIVSQFRDADGYLPRHTFFFPGEQYEKNWLDSLAVLAKNRLGEVELHLHHDGDTKEKLRRDIEQFLKLYADHGHLSRDAQGRLRYAFIHGNWCLANARADGRYCGVDEELQLLFETGCYADFTFPSAPDESQPRRINQIYWPVGNLSQKRAYESGERARVGAVYNDRMLMVEGPLALIRRDKRFGIRIENSAITGVDPATPSRVRAWVMQRITIHGRPDWVFVKIHTHGAPESTARSLLGDGGKSLHAALHQNYNDGERWALHYVSAREMFNIAIAAMKGESGNPNHFRNYVLQPPPIAMNGV